MTAITGMAGACTRRWRNWNRRQGLCRQAAFLVRNVPSVASPISWSKGAIRIARLKEGSLNSDELVDLVENPRESLEIELKEWLELEEREVQAKLARHICALANHGGGYIVFGFTDDRTPQDAPGDLSTYNHDTFSSITKKYLVPAPQCDVSLVTSSEDRTHAIVWVPSVSETPICAKADGPQDDRGRPVGINIGVHYVRAVGPESAPINQPEKWRGVLRRCVVSGRSQLLGDIEKLLRGQPESSEAKRQLIEEWHSKASERFNELFSAAADLEWPVPYADNHYHFSFVIHADSGGTKTIPALRQTLESCNHAVKDLVRSGWSMFFPFTREPIAPYVATEQIAGVDFELLETNLMAMDDDRRTPDLDFWRVATNGWASIVRGYYEDSPRGSRDESRLAPGTFFSPRVAVKLVAEFARHARAMATNYETAESVEFMCTWNGLEGRRIADFDPGIDWDRRVSRVDTRTTHGIWAPIELEASWPEVVAKLVSPVTVLFDGLEISPSWVETLAPSWLR